MQHKRLERLILFAEVAKHLSFAKAAEQLGISKGYLSEQVKRLEQEYATPLLVRTTRSVRLTLEGQKVLECGDEIKRAMAILEQSLHRLDGNIRITAPSIFTEQFLLPLCKAFRETHPDVKFDLNTSYNTYDLNQANFDMAFRATLSPPENMIAKPLLHYRHSVVASPKYIKDQGPPKSPFDLNRYECLTGQDVDSWFFKQGKVAVSGTMVSNDNHLLKRLAVENQGIVRLPDYYVQTDINEGRLVSLLQSDSCPGYDIYLLYPTTTRETARLRKFINFVVQHFEQH